MVNPLIRWEPLELEDVQNRLSKLFGRRTNGRDEITLADWTPLADITEDETEYLIKSELPDVKKEDVKVTVENGVLTISGERKFEKEEKKRKYHRVERAYGSFMRSFSLPDQADARTACSRCICQRARRPNRNKSKSTSPDNRCGDCGTCFDNSSGTGASLFPCHTG